MIDNGIYPVGYKYPDGRLHPKPANLDDILAKLPAARVSLSPSRFTDEDFGAFMQASETTKGETTGLYNVLPFIAGNESNHYSVMGLPMNNVAPFDKDLSDPNPDVYHGAAPSAIHPRVRADLRPYIIPSEAETSRPAAPNFFLEGKSVRGLPYVAKNQALLNGAVGARAIHQLQNYGAKEPEYDNKAYSFSSTYQDGYLQTYATHLTKPLTPEGQPEYHMTRTGSYAMTHSADRFREGATAYRNLRDLAKTDREDSINKANQVARQMLTPSLTTTFTDSRTSRLTALVSGSDASEDELARDEVIRGKRRKRSATASASYGSPRGRDRRTASSEIQMAISRAPLASPQNTTSKSRHGGRPAMEGSISRYLTTHTRNGTDESSVDRPSDLSRQSQSVQGSGRRLQTQPMVEVTSEWMYYKDEWGWYVEHNGESAFVPDSQWTCCEQNGQPALHCALFNIFMYLSIDNGRR